MYILCTATEEFWGAAGKSATTAKRSRDLEEDSDESEKENDVSDHPKNNVTCTFNTAKPLKLRSETFNKYSETHDSSKNMLQNDQDTAHNISDPPQFEALPLTDLEKKYEIQISSNDDDNYKTVCNDIDASYWISGTSKYPLHAFFLL